MPVDVANERKGAQLPPDSRVDIYPDGNCLYGCAACGRDVALWKKMSDVQRLQATKVLKAEFLKWLEAQGDVERQTRLDGTRPENYPTDGDFEQLATLLGGKIFLTSTTDDGFTLSGVEVPFGQGPPFLLVQSCHKSDGTPGHKAPHYDLLQAWQKRRSPVPYHSQEEKNLRSGKACLGQRRHRSRLETCGQNH